MKTPGQIHESLQRAGHRVKMVRERGGVLSVVLDDAATEEEKALAGLALAAESAAPASMGVLEALCRLATGRGGKPEREIVSAEAARLAADRS